MSNFARVLFKHEYTDFEDKHVARKRFEIKMNDGALLAAYKYTPLSTVKKNVTIITLHGFKDTALATNDVKLAIEMATQGYTVYSYDIRGHGNSTDEQYAHFEPEYFPKAMLEDSIVVFNYIKSLETIGSKYAVIGFSYGGSIALSGYLDIKEIQLICAGCAIHDYNKLWDYHRKNSPWQIRFGLNEVFFHKQNWQNFRTAFHQVSPNTHALSNGDARVRLLHCKDDPIVPYKVSFEPNRDVFKVSTEHCLVFEDGGHSFKTHHNEVIIKLLEWFNETFENC